MRAWIKQYVPPALLPPLRRIASEGVWFTGQYATWPEASACAEGYDSDSILERVSQATEKVAVGEAACERDSFLFSRMIFPFPILSVLLRAAIEGGGRLSVLDFGGSLGSTFRQCAPFLEGVQVDWRVVEQPHFVERGKARFETEALRFFPSIEEAVAAGPVDVILLSSVLQYLERPMEILGRLEAVPSRFLLMDRTPFSDRKDDFLVVQHVSPRLYPASYPCWVFSRERMLDYFSRRWGRPEEFETEEGQVRGGRTPIVFRGCFIQRRMSEAGAPESALGPAGPGPGARDRAPGGRADGEDGV